MRIFGLTLALVAGWTVSCAESPALPEETVSNQAVYQKDQVELPPQSTTDERSWLCAPCNGDGDCVEQGASCLSYGPVGNFCGQLCQLEEGCPAGYACQGGQCRLLAGECPCSDAAIAAGVKTQCQPTGGPGCSARRWCTETGLTACDGELSCEYRLTGTSFADSGTLVAANAQFAATAQLIGAPRFAGTAANTMFISTYTVTGGAPK